MFFILFAEINQVLLNFLDSHSIYFYASFKDVAAGATGTTVVAPKFSNALNLFQPGGGGQILPNIAEVAPKISPSLHLCLVCITLSGS
jgi:hypothetical protein